VLVNVPGDSLVFNEEPFGPVAAVRGFDTLDEALAEANRLPFGLAGYAFTASLKTAHAITARAAGGHAVDQPARTGLARDALRRRQGFRLRQRRRPEALDAYLNTKAVSTLIV
jgi:succinate-semialdehyde dehydrogenase/glutarate-semialdehyde dehydrogenase